MNVIPNLYHVVRTNAHSFLPSKNFIPKKYFFGLKTLSNVFHLYFTEQMTLHLYLYSIILVFSNFNFSQLTSLYLVCVDKILLHLFN